MSVAGLAGMDTALWDLRGRAAGLNVSRLIGAAATAVRAYASGGLWISSSIDELQREAADFLARGLRAMKMRVGPRSIAWNIERVRAVREAIGPDIKLMADANQSFTVAEAIRLGCALEEYNLAWSRSRSATGTTPARRRSPPPWTRRLPAARCSHASA
jgi:L-alanine-DL-glutamate epimerase-like enolase superfamily enzyme